MFLVCDRENEVKCPVYANYFYDTSVIFSNSIITDGEPFTICIGHERRTDVIGIDWMSKILEWLPGPAFPFL